MRKVLITLSVALFLSVGLHAATYHVPGDFSTIQEAVDFAADYDSVIVGPGEFEVNLTIDKPLTLTGTSAGISRLLPGEDSGAVVLVTSYDVTISFLSIRNAIAWDDHAAGLTFYGAVNCVVEQCYFVHNSQVGIGVLGSSDCVIRDCIFTDCGRAICLYGIYEPATSANTGILIEHNRILMNTTGVYFSHFEPRHSHVTIASNYFVANSNGIYTITNDTCSIHHNQFTSNAGVAVAAEECMCGAFDNEVHHNVFIDNNNGGVQAGDATSGTTVWFDAATLEGSYWSDYTGADADENGIGDDPYLIGVYADDYPLMAFADLDADGICDSVDVCPEVSDGSQTDSDMDGIGDACDFCTDYDRDGLGSGYLDTCLADNCSSHYNPEQEDFDGDGVGDSCDFQYVYHNTLWSDCLGLVVGNNGNVGDKGNSHNGGGGANLDFTWYGDECDGSADVYLFDGGPVILTRTTTDTMLSQVIHDVSNIHILDDIEVPQEAFDVNVNAMTAGSMASWDYQIGFDQAWYAFSNGLSDNCNVIVQRTRFYVLGNDPVQHVSLGEIIDWDIPSDVGSDNASSVLSDGDFNFVYLQGEESDGSGCIGNDTRFGASVMLGLYFGDSCDVEHISRQQPEAQNVLSTGQYLWPTGALVASEILPIMDDRTIAADDDTTDYSVLTTYVHDYALYPGDTLSVWMALVSVRDGTSDDVLAAVEQVDQVWRDSILHLECGCCVGQKGDIDLVSDCTPDEQMVDVGDLSNLINHLFLTFEPVCCAEEADISPTPVSDGVVDIGDLTEMIGYLFIYFHDMPYCQ